MRREVGDDAWRLSQFDAVEEIGFHHALHIVAGLVDGNMLDPVEDVDLPETRVAEQADPFGDAAGARVIGGDRHGIKAVITLDQVIKIGGAGSLL